MALGSLLHVGQHVAEELLFRGRQGAGEFDVEGHQQVAFPCRIAGQWQAVALYSLDGIWFDYFVFCTNSKLITGHRRHFKYHATECLKRRTEENVSIETFNHPANGIRSFSRTSLIGRTPRVIISHSSPHLWCLLHHRND
jgi:hypothetical protein